MPSLWQSFVPYHTVNDLIQHPEITTVGREQRFTAVALFADVSGFTAMSEALAATGKSGAEELTAILNSYFDPMIALIHSYHGIIGKFGGDAMTVLFPYEVETWSIVTQRALQCALEMQARMSEYVAIPTQIGVFSLTMKVGLAAGSVFCTNVGDQNGRLEYIIAGRVLDWCADAEHHAHSGEIVVHAQTWPAAAGVDIMARTDDFYEVRGLAETIAPAPLPDLPDLPPSVQKTLAAYVHPSLARRLQRGQLTFINEHRRVTVLFVRFTGFDYDSDLDVGQKLQAYFSQVVRIIQRYDGYLNKIDMGDKGSKYIILFGAPIAHENDEERALRCAWELQLLPDSHVQIGINTGFVYCGQVGSVRRQEYTVMGDAVNLSARLMQAATLGHILVSDQTYKASQDRFIWGEANRIHVKGKADAICVYQLQGVRRRLSLHVTEPQYVLPMVGRTEEVGQVMSLWKRVCQGVGQIVGITAVSGMGKSRLVSEVLDHIGSNDNHFFSICQSYGTTTNYLVWQNLLYELFQLDPEWEQDMQVNHLQEELAAVDTSLVARLPLLGVALNLPIPDNEWTQALDAKLRKALLEALVVDYVRYQAQKRPLLLVLEDCHWLDPLSNDLLELVGRSIVDVPVMLLVIYRPPEMESIQPHVSRFAHFTEIRLAEFTAVEARHLISLKLANLFDQQQSSDTLARRIIDRAQGNPFYIDEMLNLIHDRGIDPANTAALDALELPGSLHSLIISRIDQLAEGPKTTLKVASVIGRLFRANWLWGSYPQLGKPERVRQHLADLGRLELTPLQQHGTEQEYLFKHIVTREVAYESLAVATRTMLHEQIGAYIERRYPQELERYLDLLAYHYGQSHNTDKKQSYFAQAAEVARTNYANDVAIDYYQRLLPLAADAAKSTILLALGEVQQLIGQWDAAEQSYRQAWEIAQTLHDTRQFARSRQAIGALLRTRGAYDEALTWLHQAQTDLDRAHLHGDAADTLREIGIIHWYQGAFDTALDYFSRSQRIATSLGDQQRRYKAIGNMGLIYWHQEKYDQALACFAQCHEAAAALKDRVGLCHNYSNIGNVRLELGDNTQAMHSYVQSLQLALELGYRQGMSYSIGNMGNVYWHQGEYKQALICYSYDLQIALELGDRQGVGFAAWNTARAYLARGEYDTATAFLRQAIALGRLLDTPYDLCAFLYEQGNLYSAQESFPEARAAFAAAQELATHVENESITFEASIALSRLQVRLRELDRNTAVSNLQDMLAVETDESHIATLQYEIWQMDPTLEAQRQAAATIYRTLYQQTPNNEYRRNYEHLTGETLPEADPLPPLPEAVSRKPVPAATLIAQIDLLLTEIAANEEEATAVTHAH